jgi:hypothetical protein
MAKAKTKYDVHVTVHRDTFLYNKPTRCTDISNLLFEGNSTCFGQFLCPLSGIFHCTHSNGICHKILLTPCKQDQYDPACMLSANLYNIYHCCVYSEKFLMMDRGTVRNMLNFVPKYRVSIKSFPDYIYLSQENYVEYRHIFVEVC